MFCNKAEILILYNLQANDFNIYKSIHNFSERSFGVRKIIFESFSVAAIFSIIIFAILFTKDVDLNAEQINLNATNLSEEIAETETTKTTKDEEVSISKGSDGGIEYTFDTKKIITGKTFAHSKVKINIFADAERTEKISANEISIGASGIFDIEIDLAEGNNFVEIISGNTSLNLNIVRLEENIKSTLGRFLAPEEKYKFTK